MEPNLQTPSLPNGPSSMAAIVSQSNVSSRPTSSDSTLTTLPNNSTTSFVSTLTASSTTVPKWNIHKPQYDTKGKALDAMSRKYPPSQLENELSMEELLALPPLPKSFRFEMAKNEAVSNEVNEEEKRKEGLEAAKKKLRDLARGVK